VRSSVSIVPGIIIARVGELGFGRSGHEMAEQ
jgi:hypothetical protein